MALYAFDGTCESLPWYKEAVVKRFEDARRRLEKSSRAHGLLDTSK